MKKFFFTAMALLLTLVFTSPSLLAKDLPHNEYGYWSSVGSRAGTQAYELIKQRGFTPRKENLISLTNAGYAEMAGSSTMGFIDGLSDTTGCRRGNSTLVEIHARYDTPLWCAVYDKVSGYCVYLQLKSDMVDPAEKSGNIYKDINVAKAAASEIFEITAVEKINADHLYKNAQAYNRKFSEKIFGGNEFRIITISNALANGAPANAVKAFEYHDHYCPGVTSGIMIVNYLKTHFPPIAGGNYFVQSIQPWCKEDALMTLLNATPGKGGYSALYSTETDRAEWKPEAKEASTIIYREDKKAGKWDGVVLGFKWADSSVCKDFGEKSIITKLCMDLWYLEKLHKPEAFVKVIKQFELPKGVTPKEWARPGVDPMKLLGLTK